MLNNAQQLLAQCENNQKHLNFANAIQARGALLVVNEQRLISHASTNVGDFLEQDAHYWLGKSISSLNWITHSDIDGLSPSVGKYIDIPAPLSKAGVPVNAKLIRSEHSILIELEHQTLQTTDEYSARSPFMSFPNKENELPEHNQNYLNHLREINGFDRVMVYRFAEDWSGEVIAASSNPEFGDYLGLHFPASDIPPIMRQLYMLNPYRMISDARAPSIPLLSIDGQPADLSRSDLRQVAPIHVQFLTNMGVQAAFSMPIMINHKLWGLTTCHHRQPRWLSPLLREQCVELARNHSIGLAYYLSNTHLQMVDGIDRRITKLLEALYSDSDMLNALNQIGQELTEIMNSNGIAIVQSGQVTAFGLTPSAEGIGLIDEWFITEKENQFSTHSLQKRFAHQIEAFPASCGLFAIKVYSGGGGWVRFYWFRTQELSEIHWAGNPHEPVSQDPDSCELSPRRSFEKWIERKIGQSRPWSKNEKMTATKFRQSLQVWLG